MQKRKCWKIQDLIIPQKTLEKNGKVEKIKLTIKLKFNEVLKIQENINKTKRVLF